MQLLHNTMIINSHFASEPLFLKKVILLQSQNFMTCCSPPSLNGYCTDQVSDDM